MCTSSISLSFRHLSWVAIGILLLLVGCGGGNAAGGALPGAGNESPGTDNPSPFFPSSPLPGGEEPGPTPGDVAGGALSLRMVQVHTRGVDCGQAISGQIQASGGSGNIAWQAVNLPAWASATPTGARGEILTLGGVVPYATCDEETIEVNPQACDEAGECRGLSFSVRTDIPRIHIRTSLNDRVVTVDSSLDLELKARGGSGEYDWETSINGNSVSTGENVSQTMSTVGIHAVEVVAKDRALNDRRDALIAKYGAEDHDKLAMDVESFVVTVKENTFVITGQVKDAAGADVGDVVSSGDEAPSEELVVPYQGKFHVTLQGRSVYNLSLPIKSKLHLGKGATAVPAGGSVDITVEDSALSQQDLVVESFVLQAVNAAGEVEELSIGRITFQADPCKTLRITPYGNSSYQLLEEDAEFSFQAKNGKGPFQWSIISIVEGPEHDPAVRSGDRVTYTAFPVFNPERVSLDFDRSESLPEIRYTRADDDSSPRWMVECERVEGEGEGRGCQKIKLSGDIIYDALPKIMDPVGEASWVERGASATKFKEERDRRFTEQLFVRVEDTGCKISSGGNSRNARAYHQQPITISFPAPNREAFDGAEVAVKVTFTDTYHARDGSNAKLELVDRSGNSLASESRDVDIDCGETEDVTRWNWPDLDTLHSDDEGKKLVDIDHMRVTLDQEGDAAWDFDYTVKKLFIVGQYWYYYDGQSRHYVGWDNGAVYVYDDYEILRPDDTDQYRGWFLKCNPTQANSAGCTDDPVEFGHSGDTNACW